MNVLIAALAVAVVGVAAGLMVTSCAERKCDARSASVLVNPKHEPAGMRHFTVVDVPLHVVPPM